MFDFVEEYAEARELAWAVMQLRPQLLMMQVRAHATSAIESDDHQTAIQAVESGLDDLRAFFHKIERPDLAEQSGEVASLEAYLQEIRSTKPLSERERLEKLLDDAIQSEEYEKAARLRDQLKKLA